MTRENKEYQQWSKDVAELIADASIDAKLTDEQQFEESVDVISLEIFVRFISGDYPPPLKPKLLSNNTE